MPFTKRKSNPVRVSEVEFDESVSIKDLDELEFIANHTLCGIIRQLSNLNLHAKDVFDELYTEALKVYNRTSNLKTKVEGMKEKYKAWNKMEAGASFDKNDKENDTPLSQYFDQQLLRYESRPTAITVMYETANRPPEIAKMDQFRDDGKSGLALYTNPTFFFVNWYSQMEKNEKGNQLRKTRRQDRKTKNHGVKGGPRKVKKKEHLGKDVEYTEDYGEHYEKKHKKHKKKQMEGFSNKTWDKENKQLESAQEKVEEFLAIVTHNGSVKQGRSIQTSTVNDDKTGVKHTPPPIPMRKNSLKVSHGGDKIKPPAVDDLPPPPPDPPLCENVESDNRQTFILPPAPPDFFKNQIDSSAENERESYFPLPPPPELETDDYLPPPPLVPRRSQIRTDLRSQRISTFIFPAALESSSNVIAPDILPPPPFQKPVPTMAGPNVQPQAPPPPPPPPPPGKPHVAVVNGLSASVTKDIETDDHGGAPTENALLAMKKKLQTKERILKPPPASQSHAFDVHNIMNKALENHRKFIEDSSSEEESDYTDSDCDWD